MADNTIAIEFIPCEPAPLNGYRISYRPSGSTEEYRIWPVNFQASPAVFTDPNDELGTQYEGYIQGDCGGDGLGVPFRWSTGENSPGEESPQESPPVELLRINNFTGMAITAVYTIPVTGAPEDARLVTCDEGYPLPAGEVSDATIHPDHQGDNNLSVLVYFDGFAALSSDRVHVTDSDDVEGCDDGNNIVPIIGVTGPFRLDDGDGWEITANNVPC
jgi:hypothetical protein